MNKPSVSHVRAARTATEPQKPPASLNPELGDGHLAGLGPTTQKWVTSTLAKIAERQRALGRPLTSRERILDAQITECEWRLALKRDTISAIDEEIDGIDKRIDRLRVELARLQSPSRRRFFGSTERQADIFTPVVAAPPKRPRAFSLDPRVRWRSTVAAVAANSSSFEPSKALTPAQRIAARKRMHKLEESLSHFSDTLHAYTESWSEARQELLLDYIWEIARGEEFRQLSRGPDVQQRLRKVADDGLKAVDQAIGLFKRFGKQTSDPTIRTVRDLCDQAEAAYYVVARLPHQECAHRARRLHRGLHDYHRRATPGATGIGVPTWLIADLASCISPRPISKRTIDRSYLARAPRGRRHQTVLKSQLKAAARFKRKMEELRRLMRATNSDDLSGFQQLCEENYWKVLSPVKLVTS